MAEELLIDREELTWHHFDDPEDPELVVLASHYGLHELALEDCLTSASRPKLDDYNSYVFAILNTPSFVTEEDKLLQEKLCIFVGDTFLVTVCNGVNHAVDYAKVVSRSDKHAKSTKDVFYLLMDRVCDHFLPTIDAISDEISELETAVYEKPDEMISRRATSLKKVLTFLRRAAVGHREIINQLLRRHPPFVDERLNLYFRDIYDHLVQATDLIETDRDLLTGIVDIHLSTTAHRTNEIVKTLTIYATILLPLNVVTGYFGMNFPNLPLLHEQLGMPIVTLLLVVMVVATSFYFRKRQW